jgi:hypothetical protein
MDEIFVHAVGDGAVVVERGEDVLDRLEHILDALDVEKGLLLPRERGIRQVFGGGGRTHGETRLAVVLRQFRVGGANLLFQLRLQRRLNQPPAHHGSGFGQRAEIIDVEIYQGRVDFFGEAVVFEKFAERFGCGGKAAGHAHAGLRELTDEFAERSIFSTDTCHVGHAQPGQR